MRSGIAPLMVNVSNVMTDLYVMGYSEAFLRILLSRNCANWCGYLSEHLRAGLRVLDAGCGPGSISVGLAEAVGSEGELHGIDIEPSQVEMAVQAARERGLVNAQFRVADVKALPFEDGYFDLVHCSDVLAFVPDVSAALGEIKRVLKGGGVLGCREIIMDSFLIHPDPTGILSRGYGVFADVLAADGGHPQMGKDLAGHVEKAGFAETRVSAAFEVFSGRDRLKLMEDLGKEWYFTPEVETPAEDYGATSAGMFAEMKQAQEEWLQATGAMAAFAYGQVLTVKP